VIWVVFISVLFMLPTATPITALTFNYTPVVVLGTFVIITVWWLVSARVWFKGPVFKDRRLNWQPLREASVKLSRLMWKVR